MITPWFAALPWIHYLNFRLVECYHTARFEKETRYYAIRLERDLLGDWTLCVTNGRIKSKLGQSRILAFECFFDAYEHFCLMAKERYQRGYHPVRYDTEDVLCQSMLLWALTQSRPVPRTRKTRVPPRQTPSAPQHHEAQQIAFDFQNTSANPT